MKLKLWQVDAFAEKPFSGNPAAVVPLESWLDDGLMQAIAGENNLAETAFFVAREPGFYELRWFTPNAEVDLCGHATMASAWVLFHDLAPELKTVSFRTRSGILTVDRDENGLQVMSMPADPIVPFEGPPGLKQALGDALGTVPPEEIYKGRYIVALWKGAATIRGLTGPGVIKRVLRSVGVWGGIVTAPGDRGYDFVSRFFAPDKGVPEDPVTGSAHCALVPFWAKRLGKKQLRAFQASPRGGDLLCTDEGARVVLAGPCALYLRGEIDV